MQGAIKQLIRSQGSEFDVQNATGGSGRDVPSYSKDGTLIGVLDRRGQPRTVTDTDGTEVEADLEIRAILDGTISINDVDEAGYPTRLVHPSGERYRVMHTYSEDSGVSVLTVVED